MAYRTVIDCTNDINIRHFLQSDRCYDIRLVPAFVENVYELGNHLYGRDPIVILLSTNVMSISDMYKLITEQYKGYKYILCVGQTKNKRDKQKLKVLQEEYNCSIIENVVTDLILFNYLVECMMDGQINYHVNPKGHDMRMHDYIPEPTVHYDTPTPVHKDTTVNEDVENFEDLEDDVVFE